MDSDDDEKENDDDQTAELSKSTECKEGDQFCTFLKNLFLKKNYNGENGVNNNGEAPVDQETNTNQNFN
jgi:hypothetical protein